MSFCLPAYRLTVRPHRLTRTQGPAQSCYNPSWLTGLKTPTVNRTNLDPLSGTGLRQTLTSPSGCVLCPIGSYSCQTEDAIRRRNLSAVIATDRIRRCSAIMAFSPSICSYQHPPSPPLPLARTPHTLLRPPPSLAAADVDQASVAVANICSCISAHLRF